LVVHKRSEQEPERLWKRVQFLMRKDEVGEKMARLTVLTGKLSSIQISLFLKYVFQYLLSGIPCAGRVICKGSITRRTFTIPSSSILLGVFFK